MSYNPFDRYKKGFTLDTQGPLDFMKAAIGASPKIQQQRIEEKKDVATGEPVQLPRHLYTPEGARSVDIRRLVVLAPGSINDIMTFVAPEATTVFFTHYAIFNDALDAALVEFIPQVNRRRIYPFHGDPDNNFRISLGLAPDLGNEALIEGQLQLNPGDTLVWTAVNNDVVNVIMGVRMKGYVDSTTSRTNRVFGG